jgi:serine/threonine protein kinase
MIIGGGVHLDRPGGYYNTLTPKDFEDAFYKFIENSKFKILTDSSISGITLVATLNDGVDSPYVSVNPDSPTFIEKVKKILIKIMPSVKKLEEEKGHAFFYRIDLALTRDQGLDKKDNFLIKHRINNKGDNDNDGGVEINTHDTINKEVKRQKEIYRKTLLNPDSLLYAACPGILHVENPIRNHAKFYDIIIEENFVSRKKDRDRILKGEAERTVKAELDEIDEFYSVANYIKIKENYGKDYDKNGKAFKYEPLYSIIVMEFLEKFDTLKTIELKLPRYDKEHVGCLIFHELEKIHKLNYYHNDLHHSNVMLNMESEYGKAVSGFRGIESGRAIIIDFGRIKKKTDFKPAKLSKGKPKNLYCAGIIPEKK